jgi:hypothetical protein
MSVPSGLDWIFAALITLSIVPTLYYLGRESRRTRSAVPSLILAGGAIAALGAPMIDHLALVWWPLDIKVPTIKAFGIRDPIFEIPGYALFMGACTYWCYAMIRDGRGPHAVWGAAALLFVGDMAMEMTFINLGLYHYYGPQPLEIAGYPLTWAALNAALIPTGAYLLHIWTPRLHGWRQLEALALPPLALGAVVATGWPLFTVLHIQIAQGLREIGGLITVTLCVWLVSCVADASSKIRATQPRAASARRDLSDAAEARLPTQAIA